jgi:hypothetical protein
LSEPVQPYITGGAGLYIPESGATKLGAEMGIGVDRQFNQSWGLEVGADYHNIFTSGDDVSFWVIRAGLNLRL